jgi:hypothetical protein
MKYPPFTAGKAYSLRGKLVQCVMLKTWGRGPLVGVQVAELRATDGSRFGATRWADGTVGRITPMTPLPT